MRGEKVSSLRKDGARGKPGVLDVWCTVFWPDDVDGRNTIQALVFAGPDFWEADAAELVQ